MIKLEILYSYRKKGIARMLVAKKQNLKISIFVCSDLCGFYEKFGFVFHTMAYDVFGFHNRIYRLES
ncbi:hypothetical protein Hc94105_0072 [Helicobacter cinaedi]|uniref:hypothetical protein n=1 Tax=Helicobacter cinaedi TaxID=213 RepID=UPI001F3F4CF7|nr:hypothetical protein [Helicobacter cinaedi]BDB65893.1 hypothetical protein Hc94105_0072 [Helicobacter cinaedi]